MTSAYRTNYSLQYVIIWLVEKWRIKVDNNFVVGALLTGLSKAFNCIPHGLLIAKFAAYVLGEEALMYIHIAYSCSYSIFILYIHIHIHILTFDIASIVLKLIILTMSLKI